MRKPNRYTRTREGRRLRYWDQDSEVTNKTTLDYLTSLRIPPAWRDVEIAKNQNAKVLVKGLDKAGRGQSIYHPNFRRRQEKAKFESLLLFAETLPKLRMQLQRDIKRPELDREKVLACIVWLIDEAYFRVGNQSYADKNATYGITTMRSKHLTFRGSSIIFDFVGKSHKAHHKTITNKQITDIVRELDQLPGHEVFKYLDTDGNLHDVDSNDVNEYIKEHMGEDFSAKNFRTWGGTLHATVELATSECGTTKLEQQKAVTACVNKVALQLGNTPAIARAAYIDPKILDTLMKPRRHRELQSVLATIRPTTYLSRDELFMVHILQNS